MRSQLNWIQKGRILYGNETDVNEYPWQVLSSLQIVQNLKSTKSMSKRKIWDEIQGVDVDWPKSLLWRNSDQWWMDCYSRPLCWPPIQVNIVLLFHILFSFWCISCMRSSSSGGTLIELLSALEITMSKSTTIQRMSSGWRMRETSSFCQNILSCCRKLKRIVRSPQYDNNFINGDMALLQLEKKVFGWIQKYVPTRCHFGGSLCNFLSQVTFSDTIRPACLPEDPTETYGYAVS